MIPRSSKHYSNRKPSAIRTAQISFHTREDKAQIQAINLAIGNVSLPMHPYMINRMKNLIKNPHFERGIIRYTPTTGQKETIDSFLNIISYEGADISKLNCLVTDGGSQSMEIMLLGVCGPSSANPIMLLDPAYTNYLEFSKRLSIPIISLSRSISSFGNFDKLNFVEMESFIKAEKPNGLVVIPFDNPTGQFINQEDLIKIASICVKNEIWLISDEAYRQLYYNKESSSSIWKITENDVPNISGFRISIESASKVWNACGLRIGAMVTDNMEFYKKAVYEYTANLCANSLGQYIFGALSKLSHNEMGTWYAKQRKYYFPLMNSFRISLIKEIPGILVSKPSAAIYLVIDFKNICQPDFDASDFILYCAKKGKVNIQGQYYTVLFAPMNEFYSGNNNIKTQIRIAIVENENFLKIAPRILSTLYINYTNQKT